MNFAQQEDAASKSFNPLHSSQILIKSGHKGAPEKKQEGSKLSQWFTRANSQMGGTEVQGYASLVDNYQHKIKSLQGGFERSKEQFENSLKQMYKEKIILLNIIGHNQDLVDEFRNKVKMGPQTSFKQVETKYNIISSGLFHNQLCSNCIACITRADTQANRQEERQSPRHPSRNTPSRQSKQFQVSRQLQAVKQYSWMYAPAEDVHAAYLKLKAENNRLRAAMEETILDHLRRTNEKNKEIEHLKMQIAKSAPSSVQKIVHVSPVDSREKAKQRDLLKQTQIKQEATRMSKEGCEGLIKELNEKLVERQLQRLNAKYKMKYF